MYDIKDVPHIMCGSGATPLAPTGWFYGNSKIICEHLNSTIDISATVSHRTKRINNKTQRCLSVTSVLQTKV